MSGVPQAKGPPGSRAGRSTSLYDRCPDPRRGKSLFAGTTLPAEQEAEGGGGAAPRCTTFLSGCKWLPRSPLSAQFPDPPAPGAGVGPCTSRPPAIRACRGSRGCCGPQPARPGAGQLPRPEGKGAEGGGLEAAEGGRSGSRSRALGVCQVRPRRLRVAVARAAPGRRPGGERGSARLRGAHVPSGPGARRGAARHSFRAAGEAPRRSIWRASTFRPSPARAAGALAGP